MSTSKNDKDYANENCTPEEACYCKPAEYECSPYDSCSPDDDDYIKCTPEESNQNSRNKIKKLNDTNNRMTYIEDTLKKMYSNDIELLTKNKKIVPDDSVSDSALLDTSDTLNSPIKKPHR